MRWLILMIALCGTAHAQTPGEASPQSEPDSKSVAGAYALTVMATMVPLTVGVMGAEETSDDHPNRQAMFTGLGVAALVLGPSAGHWYVGEGITTGLVIRTAAAAGIGAIALAAPPRMTEKSSPSGLVIAGLIMGVGAWETGLIWDLATVPRSVHRYNKRHQLQLAPMAAPHTTGLALAGTF
jgi:hypothetical protein